MARVLAAGLNGYSAKFKAADQSAILKLEGTEVAAVGQHQADCPSYSSDHDGAYRRISVRHGRLVGAIGVGGWPEQARIREAIKRGRRIWPWNINRFVSQGRLWSPAKTDDVSAWPESAEICNCMSVCKRTISEACAEECRSVEELGRRTGAGTVCGSCRPLLARLVGAPMPTVTPLLGRGWLMGASLLAVVFCALFAVFEIPFSPSASGGWKPEQLWTERFFKQVTGFSLVGVSLLGMVLSLRKRIRRFTLGDYGLWRALHAALGGLTLVVLVTHTGLHLGANLNRVLMLNFLALSLTGALAGVVTALESRLQGVAAVWLRRSWTLLHVLLVWPLPVLIFFHAFASYYY